MDKASRIKDLLNAKTCEGLLYSFWTHFPNVDLDAKSLAEVSYSFYKELDLDFIKSMPNGMHSILDWGCECDFSQIAAGGIARVTRAAVEKPEDWNKLQELDIEKGSLGRELFSLKLLLQYVNKAVPVIAITFVGVYTINNSTFDLYIMLILGLLGYAMDRLKYPTAPVVLGLVLGPMAEQQLRLAMIICKQTVFPYTMCPGIVEIPDFPAMQIF